MSQIGTIVCIRISSMRIKNYKSKIVNLFLGAFFFATVLLGVKSVPIAVAAPYGCGNYGSDAYQNNCPTPPSSTPSSSSSSPDTADSSEPTEVAMPEGETVIVLNVYEDFFTETGITVTQLEVGDVIAFCIDSESAATGCTEDKIDHHTATIKKIDLSDPENPVITITFASSPFDVDFKKGETKKIDLDKDGTEDVEVTFVDLVDGHPIVTMKKINPLGTNTSTPETTTAEDTSGSNDMWLWVIGIGSALCAIFALAIVARHKKRTKNVSW